MAHTTYALARVTLSHIIITLVRLQHPVVSHLLTPDGNTVMQWEAPPETLQCAESQPRAKMDEGVDLMPSERICCQ